MSETEIKQMQEKINAGILLARKRLIEKTKKEDGELVIVRDGKVVRIKAKDLKYFVSILMIHPRPYSRGFLFTETKAIELFPGQTLQRGLKYTPLRKFVPSLMLYLLNSLIV